MARRKPRGQSRRHHSDGQSASADGPGQIPARGLRTSKGPRAPPRRSPAPSPARGAGYRRHLRGDSLGRHSTPPSLSGFRHVRAAFRRIRRPRSPGAGHQADDLSHQRTVTHHPRLSSRPPAGANRSSSWSRSRRASTRRRTLRGGNNSRRPERMWNTGWNGSRPT